ncbi:hypothetical protein DMI62_21150 [Escherichia coli]|nr:hypothetical protein [Escherichia coli]
MVCILDTPCQPLTGECVCFQEYRDLISRLKNENPRFMSLFDKHNKLDHEIARKEGSDGRGYNAEVVRMKKQKLQLKG